VRKKKKREGSSPMGGKKNRGVGGVFLPVETSGRGGGGEILTSR